MFDFLKTFAGETSTLALLISIGSGFWQLKLNKEKHEENKRLFKKEIVRNINKIKNNIIDIASDSTPANNYHDKRILEINDLFDEITKDDFKKYNMQEEKKKCIEVSTQIDDIVQELICGDKIKKSVSMVLLNNLKKKFD